MTGDDLRRAVVDLDVFWFREGLALTVPGLPVDPEVLRRCPGQVTPGDARES